MPSRDIFTALNLTSTYRTEHVNNIYSFSILQRWLIVLQKYDAELWNNIVRKIPKYVVSFYVSSLAFSNTNIMNGNEFPLDRTEALRCTNNCSSSVRNP